MNQDPPWKRALNWGAVITFLTLPMVLLVIQVWNWTHPGFLTLVEGKDPHIEYLREFMRNITILVFGLAGLRTWEQIKNGKKPTNDNHDQTYK